MKILIINGPNLNLLGTREPHIYGRVPFDDYLSGLREHFPDVDLGYAQSNHEGDLIDQVQEAEGQQAGLVLNAGGLTHTSVALADAVAAITVPTVEVHLSNVYAREPYRHRSYLSPHCAGVIVGCGMIGYRLAVSYLIEKHLNV